MMVNLSILYPGDAEDTHLHFFVDCLFWVVDEASEELRGNLVASFSLMAILVDFQSSINVELYFQWEPEVEKWLHAVEADDVVAEMREVLVDSEVFVKNMGLDHMHCLLEEDFFSLSFGVLVNLRKIVFPLVTVTLVPGSRVP